MNRLYRHIWQFLDIYLFLLVIIVSFLFAIQIDYFELKNYVIFNENSYSSVDIFFNNLKVYLFIILGIFTLGISSILILFINFLNIFIHIFTESIRSSLAHAINYIIRYAVIEILGFFMAFSITIFFIKALYKKNFSKFKDEVMIRLILGIILLIIAAFIEGNC